MGFIRHQSINDCSHGIRNSEVTVQYFTDNSHTNMHILPIWVPVMYVKAFPQTRVICGFPDIAQLKFSPRTTQLTKYERCSSAFESCRFLLLKQTFHYIHEKQISASHSFSLFVSYRMQLRLLQKALLKPLPTQ